jgi:hypothetical protein
MAAYVAVRRAILVATGLGVLDFCYLETKSLCRSEPEALAVSQLKFGDQLESG